MKEKLEQIKLEVEQNSNYKLKIVSIDVITDYQLRVLNTPRNIYIMIDIRKFYLHNKEKISVSVFDSRKSYSYYRNVFEYDLRKLINEIAIGFEKFDLKVPKVKPIIKSKYTQMELDI